MQNDELILAEEFCSIHRIEVSFISSLSQFGLLNVTSMQEHMYIPVAELQKLEQIMRLHYELDINLEGIDAIHHLLDRVSYLQEEIGRLRSKLNLYEQ